MANADLNYSHNPYEKLATLKQAKVANKIASNVAYIASAHNITVADGADIGTAVYPFDKTALLERRKVRPLKVVTNGLFKQTERPAPAVEAVVD